MKKILMLLLILILWTGMANAAGPYLVCDPYPESAEITHFVLVLNGEAPIPIPDPCHFDLSGLPNGDYTVILRAVSMWGESADSDPFLFSKQLPSKPSGVGLSNL